ncbi:MAG: peptidoglycan recognition protein family protein [Planctomycetota bacterium]|jgi:hypothetical protein
MHEDSVHLPSAEAGTCDDAASRRAFLARAMAASMAGSMALLAGCTKTGQTARALPGPAWPAGGADPIRTAVHQPAVQPTANAASLPPGVIRRQQWAAGRPMPTLMQPMLPVRSITVHHCAGTPFTSSDRATTVARLEKIRRYHRSDKGWGDIGYHFAIDRSGNVWECRPLQWQGAHVGGHNEGNIGVVVIGHFDEQRPSQAQVAGLHHHLKAMMATHRIPVSRLKTHQEWAATACPGRNLQSWMDDQRRRGAFG